MANLSGYTIGWICALECESVAAELFLDKVYDNELTAESNDDNSYTLGEYSGPIFYSIVTLAHKRVQVKWADTRLSSFHYPTENAVLPLQLQS